LPLKLAGVIWVDRWQCDVSKKKKRYVDKFEFQELLHDAILGYSIASASVIVIYLRTVRNTLYIMDITGLRVESVGFYFGSSKFMPCKITLLSQKGISSKLK
jgi:hypothetical protein